MKLGTPTSMRSVAFAAFALFASSALAGCPFSRNKRSLLSDADYLKAASGPAPSPNPNWAPSLPGSVNASDPFVAMNGAFTLCMHLMYKIRVFCSLSQKWARLLCCAR